MSSESKIPVWRKLPRTPRPQLAAQRLQTLIVGAGPVGLTAALDLAQRGHAVTVLSKLDFIAAGSKAICFSKRTLDIWDRLGIGETLVEKGVVWNVGKVFWGADPEPVYQFDMLPVKNQKMPGFINLQQYSVEQVLVEALQRLPNVELRWGHSVAGLKVEEQSVRVSVDTAQGPYTITTDWLIACDGCRSSIRGFMGLDFEGRAFEDHFLVADVRIKQERPSERWFWFDPPFHPGQSALLHKQPDDVWRCDFQLGREVDRDACVRPENVDPLVRGMLGDDIEFTHEWTSVYTFQCRRMSRFVHGRVIFAGDSAHLVSPFGARGCNGGVADADNLVWKLDLILRDQAPTALLETYNDEAITTADENILNSTRSTDFLSPPTVVSRAFRDSVLELAADWPFARPLVNSGRLSTAVSYPDTSLNTADTSSDWAGIRPGHFALDAPLEKGWLLSALGNRFALLTHGWAPSADVDANVIDVSRLERAPKILLERYDLKPGSAYLIRPDHYVTARWRQPTVERVKTAMMRARGLA